MRLPRPQLLLLTCVVLAAGLLMWPGAPARSQDGGPGYGSPGDGPPGYGPPGMGPDGMGPGDAGPYGMGPGGPGPYGMGPGGPGPYGMGPGGPGPYGMGPRGDGPDGGPGPGVRGGYPGDGPMGAVADEGPQGDGGGEGLTERSVSVHGTQRPYYVHVPANLARPAPVVFMFHGGGGRPQAIAAKTGWNEEADRHGFIVVYGEGAPAPSGRGGTWNVGGSFTRSDADDVAYVAAILHDLRGTENIDPARIYAAGHSMGGVFTYRLACEMSDTFAAIAPVSATMVEPHCRPTSPVAVFHIQGSADERIPLDGGHGEMTAQSRSWPAPRTGIVAWSHLDGCSAQPSRTTDGPASCETWDHCRATVEMCVLQGGRHAWPEGAADQIWSFFAAHPKAAS